MGRIAAALAFVLPLAAWQAADATRRVVALHQSPSTEAQRARTPLPPDPARVVRHVRPRDADPSVSQFLLDHYAIFYGNVPRNGLLFLFFPGTYGWPANNQLLLDTAARAGYLVLGLEYPSTTLDPARASLRSLCEAGADTACAGAVRRERMYGEDASPLVEVKPADAIATRTERALAWLARAHPDDGWERFLAPGGGVRWERVAAAGHSQGAGMAAFLAKRVALARVCLFSGGADFTRGASDFAAWVRQPSATPPARIWGLVHEKEGIYHGVVAGFDALGVPASQVVKVSLAAAPAPAFGDPPHGSTASDSLTPRAADGTPRYREPWLRVIGGR